MRQCTHLFSSVNSQVSCERSNHYSLLKILTHLIFPTDFEGVPKAFHEHFAVWKYRWDECTSRGEEHYEESKDSSIKSAFSNKAGLLFEYNGIWMHVVSKVFAELRSIVSTNTFRVRGAGSIVNLIKKGSNKRDAQRIGRLNYKNFLRGHDLQTPPNSWV